MDLVKKKIKKRNDEVSTLARKKKKTGNKISVCAIYCGKTISN